jgi:ATP-dependent protease ClpP protease subunit/uncharacterized coiled-coil protein SlyX
MEAQIYLLGDIGKDEQLQPNGISDIAFIAECEKQIRAGATSLAVHIDSNGGLVAAGNNIVNYLQSCSVPVKTINEGKAYSIASKIFLAGGYRKMKPKSKIMIHNNWASGIQGDADDVQAAADHLAATEKQLRKEYATITGLNEDVIDGLMKSETYIDAETALSLGLAHEILQEDLVLAKHSKTKTNKMDFSKRLKQWASSLLKEKNMLVTLTDGTELFIDSETEDITNKSVFLAQDGVPTEQPAPNGEHTLTSGKVIVVAEGIITEVKDTQAAAEPKKDEEMAAKVAELEAALAEKTNELNTLKETLSVTQSEIAQVNKQFTELAKSIKSDYKAPAATPQFGRTKVAEENKFEGFSKQALIERNKQLANK